MNYGTFDFLAKSTVGVWKSHSSCDGVSLASILLDDDSSWRSLLVQIDAGKAIHPHAHDHETGIHFVIRGRGFLHYKNKKMDYCPGTYQKIDRMLEHEVIAGDEGLLMVAIFIME